ncbi:MAG: alpha/beta hydrolase-fold protein [Verrucomicrobiota bacterium]|nr:alpha/beta hydrolase-fold protein [Verrucomicrobiota bacterium]
MSFPLHGALVENPFPSAIFQTNRFVRVYLPPSYPAEAKRHYPVLYLHDGQNCFSSAGPHAAFGWGNWELDRTVDRLVSEKKMAEIIMVAVDCSEKRYSEYRGATNASGASGLHKNYTRFLIEELKPHIDRTYRTLKDPANTGVMGSSMGGICSLSLGWEHPEIFGKLASISGAFQVEKRAFINQVLKPYNGTVKPLKIYIDSGKIDHSGGDDGLEETEAAVKELRRIGWGDGNLFHFIDLPLTAEALQGYDLNEEKFREAQKSQHNEFYWRLRAWRALTFLFPPASN